MFTLYNFNIWSLALFRFACLNIYISFINCKMEHLLVFINITEVVVIWYAHSLASFYIVVCEFSFMPLFM